MLSRTTVGCGLLSLDEFSLVWATLDEGLNPRRGLTPARLVFLTLVSTSSVAGWAASGTVPTRDHFSCSESIGTLEA